MLLDGTFIVCTYLGSGGDRYASWLHLMHGAALQTWGCQMLPYDVFLVDAGGGNFIM